MELIPEYNLIILLTGNSLPSCGSRVRVAPESLENKRNQLIFNGVRFFIYAYFYNNSTTEGKSHYKGRPAKSIKRKSENSLIDLINREYL